MPRFAPDSAQTICASLGLGLVLAREYLERGWGRVGTARGKTPMLSAAVVGNLATSIPEFAEPIGRPGSGLNARSRERVAEKLGSA